MGSRLDLGRLRGRECLKPPLAIIPVNRQIFAGAIRPGGVEDQSSKELIAGRDVSDDGCRVPRLAERRLYPTIFRQLVDRLQIPARRLGELADLLLHLGHLIAPVIWPTSIRWPSGSRM